MEVASMILGIASLAFGYCSPIGFALGGTAIILSYLSMGGKETRSSKAKLGMWLGIGGIVIGLICLGMSIYSIIQDYGSLQSYYNYILEQSEKMSNASSFYEYLNEYINEYMNSTGY